MAKPAIDVALNNSSIDELLNPKTGSPTRGEYQPLNSNSISLAKLLKLRPTLLLVMVSIPHFVEQGLDVVAQTPIL